jgi:hypothetical protein
MGQPDFVMGSTWDSTLGFDVGPPAGGGELFVRDHFAKVGDVPFDSGDFLRPGSRALVRYSGGVLSFGFGKHFEGVLQLLLKRGAGHRGKGIT